MDRKAQIIHCVELWIESEGDARGKCWEMPARVRQTLLMLSVELLEVLYAAEIATYLNPDVSVDKAGRSGYQYTSGPAYPMQHQYAESLIEHEIEGVDRYV